MSESKKKASYRSSLREARLEAGYSTMKEFAESIGIPVSSYARYERVHDWQNAGLPISTAWMIADALDTTIDAIVGRSGRPLGGKVQQFYDNLSNANKARMDQFMSYVGYLEETETKYGVNNG